MSVIYEPKGAAREYSPFACNIYLSCTHKCKYCYAPHALQRQESVYFCPPSPRKDILKNIKKELAAKKYDKQILLSFIGDVYCESLDSGETTTKALELFLKFGAPLAILTKGGKRCLKDLDIFKQFGKNIQVGSTLTFFDEAKSIEWESGAALPKERLEVLKTLHDNGIKTFVSFEPVIEPDEALKLIEKTLQDNSVDLYKIGKLNNYKGLDKKVDWTKFLNDCLKLLRPMGKQIYIKKSLQPFAKDFVLSSDEIEPERYIVKI